VDDAEHPGAVQGLPLEELRGKLLAALTRGPEGPLQRTTILGEVEAGETFEAPFGPALLFRLEPIPLGWTIAVRETGRDEELARLTPPLHAVPGPLEIEGWHFRNADNTGPNEPGEKNVNVPGEVREFCFSPEVGRSIQGPRAAAAPTPEEIERVRGFGEGELTVLDYRLTGREPGRQAGLASLRFQADLSWRNLPRLDERYRCVLPAAGGNPFEAAAGRLEALRGRRVMLEAYLSTLEGRIAAVLEKEGISRRMYPRKWREAVESQARSEAFRAYSVEMWGGRPAGAGKASPSIRCNLLCADQASFAESAPALFLRDRERDLRFDWTVETGDPEADERILALLRETDPAR
jgi:hypothetical protein